MPWRRNARSIDWRLCSNSLGRQRLEQLAELPVMRTQPALGIEHFVEKPVVLVLSEQALDRLRFGLGGHFKTSVARIGKWE